MASQKTIDRWTQEVQDAGYEIKPSGLIFLPCHRCGGSGVFHYYAMGAPQIGTCFRCEGGRGQHVSVEVMAKRIRQRASAARSAAKKRAAQKVAAREAATRIVLADAELREAFQGSKNDFIRRIARKMFHFGEITEKQRAAVIKARAGERKYEAAKERAEEIAIDIPTEFIGKRTRIIGRVVSTKWKDSDYGFSLKMLLAVPFNGGEFKLWGTVPSAIVNATEDAFAEQARREDADPVIYLKGASISFDAKVEVSQNDAGFGFFSRPTKSEVTFAA